LNMRTSSWRTEAHRGNQARRALTQTHPPQTRSYPLSEYPQSDQERRQGLIPAAVDLADRRAFYRRVIAEIRLNPRTAERSLRTNAGGRCATETNPQIANLQAFC
jgi:hypothetical protein